MHLNRLVQQVMDLTRARWSDMPQQRGIVIQLRTELAPNLPAIAGIESEIREALINLVFNAVDAMPEGGTLTLRTKVDKGGASASGPQQVDVEVADTGVGMDEADAPPLSGAVLHNQRRARHRSRPGHGVWHRPTAQCGDRNRKRDRRRAPPCALSFRVLAADRSGSAGLPSRPPCPRLRILVVDDDPLLIKSLRDTLEADGHAVVTANGGQEGIETFTAALDSKRARSRWLSPTWACLTWTAAKWRAP